MSPGFWSRIRGRWGWLLLTYCLLAGMTLLQEPERQSGLKQAVNAFNEDIRLINPYGAFGDFDEVMRERDRKLTTSPLLAPPPAWWERPVSFVKAVYFVVVTRNLKAHTLLARVLGVGLNLLAFGIGLGVFGERGEHFVVGLFVYVPVSILIACVLWLPVWLLGAVLGGVLGFLGVLGSAGFLLYVGIQLVGDLILDATKERAVRPTEPPPPAEPPAPTPGA
ncbi:MAG: hypothetical protein AB1758_01785 [Candidatus Eremiobacterota bacterium]